MPSNNNPNGNDDDTDEVVTDPDSITDADRSALNPFRQARREQRDAIDAAKAEIRDEVEPVPDVVCISCPDRPVMDYRRELSQPQPRADAPIIEAVWECPSCNGSAYGYVTPDGLTPILDNARPADDS